MFSGPKKPFTAVTVHIDRLTSEEYEENDLSGIPDLVEVIRIQDTGPAEAARALRKKLKYGNMHRQLRSLTILDGLIQNAGARFQRTFADEPLLERLRMMPRDDLVDPDVRTKCNTLYRQWAHAYKNVAGLQSIATLYKQLPNKKKPQQSQSKVIQETEAEAAASSPPSSPMPAQRTVASSNFAPPSASWAPQRPITLEKTERSSFFKSSKDKNKNKRKPFNLEREKGQILETIAAASVASTNLFNALKLINRENTRVSENSECKHRFDKCKALRRQVLRYINVVESEQYIGSLLTANDELVKALMAYEIMDKSIEDDSDSDAEYQVGKANFESRMSGQHDAEQFLAGLSINEPPPPKSARPSGVGMPPPIPIAASTGKQRAQQPEEEEEGSDGLAEDDDDPFGDSHAVKTPFVEKDGMTWRDV
ncbi:hypothetical protein EJ08DRAFT_514284 [Tothia fuscella]|uniref:VHS domain-containing protein n=1 Tax=Tothia fuscella TaxID=1048955 RepID=A0A9P4NZU6_9PEZI|nr:hypothetical protein EJ08DRAFT_514284 [Tothia fuscella]